MKSNVTTQELIPKAPVDFLSKLESLTQEIIFIYIEKQKNAIVGDNLVIFDAKQNNKVFLIVYFLNFSFFNF